MTIYDVLGRQQGIRAAVDEFYVRVLADPHLAHYFAGADMPRLRRHQVLLLSTVTGGPEEYEGREMRAAHGHLAIAPDDFDRVVGHLGSTLEHLGVAEEMRGQVAGALMSHRDDIVTEKAETP